MRRDSASRRATLRLAVAALLAAIAGCSAPAPPAPMTVADAAAAVQAQPQWLADSARCPADFMARDEVDTVPRERFCASAEPGACFARCVDGEAGSCYWLAQDLLAADADRAAIEALFQRACKLGIASGCTNHAAGALLRDEAAAGRRDCALRTFGRACELDDPWGCTMYARELTSPTMSAEDRTHALAALDKSCLLGDDDPACVGGHVQRERILAVGIEVEEPRAVKRSPAEALIDGKIAGLGDWRGEMLARLRALIHAADPDVIEEWKWSGPVWSHAGILCTGETYKAKVKLTFAHGAALADPRGLFNASLDGNVRRALDVGAGENVDADAFKVLVRAAVAHNEAAATAKAKPKKS